ncbi:MAG: hypothetical protein U0744_11265 [Gemmataceae bacterium]
MRHVWMSWFVAGALICLGCTDTRPGVSKRAKVEGTVELDGKPMPDGEIRFSIPAEPPASLEIKDGAYSGEVPEGKNKVEIYRFKEDKTMTPPPKVNILPRTWNAESKLTVDITASSKQVPAFTVTSK